jgi:[protein-PII] uridylyltransferase
MISQDALSALHSLADARRKHLESLRFINQGLSWCQKNTTIVDAAIALVISELVGTDLDDLVVVATGGYARCELAPFSDADLTVVTSSQTGEETDRRIRIIFTALSELIEPIMSIKISYAYRLISDIEGIDPITRSALLDVRNIIGSESIFDELVREVKETHPVGEFIAEKLAERDQQLSKSNLTPLVSEPNLKEGAGGLRDYHVVNWIRDSLGETRALPSKPYDTLLASRNLLQKMIGKKSDLLNRARQAEIAEFLGMSIDSFMQMVTSSAESIHRAYLNSVESIPDAAFKISQGVHARKGEVWVEPGTEAGNASVGIAFATKLGIKVTDFPTGCSAANNGAAILFALSTGTRTVRNLDKCGLLSHILPELQACRYLQAVDAVHQFTIFEHSLKVAENLFEYGKGGWLQEVYDQIADDGLMVMAALLHDVGKKDPNRDHSEYGAEIAVQIGKRINLSSDQIEMLHWLIANHLTMDHFMRLRDLDQAQTISEFCEVIPSIDALNHLTLLTIADTSAVAPHLWSSSQETFLRKLYERSLEHLTASEPIVTDVSLSRKNVLRLLKNSPDAPKDAQELLDQLPAYYLASTPSEAVRIHVNYVKEAREGETIIETFDRLDINATEFTICSRDQHALLSKILGVFYAFELSISDIKACTTTSMERIALDVITVRFNGQCIPPATRKQVAVKLRDVITGEIDHLEFMKSKAKDPFRKLEIIEWSTYQGTPTRLEVRCPRGRGVAFRLSQWIASQNWNIQSARLGQWAGKAAATFYLNQPEGEISEKCVKNAVLQLGIE